MFTGVIRHLGQVVSRKKHADQTLLEISSSLSSKLKKGDSIAVNGVCQTVISHQGPSFTVELMPETLRVTTLGKLIAGTIVNLELPLKLSDTIDGHLLSGHVDSIGEITAIKSLQNAKLLTVKFPGSIKKYIARKGSIAIDGISLTIVDVKSKEFTVSIVSHTLKNTNLKQAKPGMKVNLEIDLVARYLESLLTTK